MENKLGSVSGAILVAVNMEQALRDLGVFLEACLAEMCERMRYHEREVEKLQADIEQVRQRLITQGVLGA